MAKDEKIWTKDQVRNLRERQARPDLHEYTCSCSKSLVPTQYGWYCRKCGIITQTWAQQSDLDGVLPPRLV